MLRTQLALSALLAAATVSAPGHAQVGTKHDPGCDCEIIVPQGPAGTYVGRHWPGGRVPYGYASSCTSTQKAQAKKAMQVLQGIAGIEFVARSNETDWVYIEPSSSNRSSIGRVGGRQRVEISSWQNEHIIVHEFIHALGFWHEQQRPDRDMFVGVDTTGMSTTQKAQYAIQKGGSAWGTYDFDSVMHYSSSSAMWVKAPFDTTWGTRIGQRSHLSPTDVYELRAVYGFPFSAVHDNVTILTAPGNARSEEPAISGNGRFIAFYSKADNLVKVDTNRRVDVFVYDRIAKTYELISVSSAKVQQNDHSQHRPSISADGNLVAFSSPSNNLVPNDTNGREDIFVRNRALGTTERVSLTDTGKQATSGCFFPVLSADGKWVIYRTPAPMVSGDTNGVTDVFLRDIKNKKTYRVSVGDKGQQGNGDSEGASISVDGHYVAFQSLATNFASGDTNADNDVFLWSRSTRTSQWITKGGNKASWSGGVTAGGDVVFSSESTNLVSGDTNNRGDVFYKPLGSSISRVSVGSDGRQSDGHSGTARPQTCSWDGRYVLFQTLATNLADKDKNGVWDLYLHDRVTRVTAPVSLANGRPMLTNFPNAACDDGAMSGDGRYVAFHSYATNLGGGNNGHRDVFLRSIDSRPLDYFHSRPSCYGAGAKPEIFIRGFPVIGNDAFGFTFFKAKPSSPFFLLVSPLTGSGKLGPCWEGVSLSSAFILPSMSDSTGNGAYDLPIPNLKTLHGASVFLQGANYDQAGPWMGFSFTGAVRVSVQD